MRQLNLRCLKAAGLLAAAVGVAALCLVAGAVRGPKIDAAHPTGVSAEPVADGRRRVQQGGENETLAPNATWINATNATNGTLPVWNSTGAWGGALHAHPALSAWRPANVSNSSDTTRLCTSHLDGAVCDDLVERLGCDAEVSAEHAQGMRVGQICEAHCSGCVCEDMYQELVQHHSTVHAPHTEEHVSPCTQLLAPFGRLTCDEHFCPECDFRGLCDATCGICQRGRLAYEEFECGESRTNAYDTLTPGGCQALLQSGLTCVADFCSDCAHRGFCDYECEFCEVPPPATEPVGEEGNPEEDGRNEEDDSEPAANSSSTSQLQSDSSEPLGEPASEATGPEPAAEPAVEGASQEPQTVETEGDSAATVESKANTTKAEWCLSFTVGDRAKGNDAQGSMETFLCHSPIVWIASLLTFGCVVCSCAGFCIGYKTAPHLAHRRFKKEQRKLAGQHREIEMGEDGIPRGDSAAEGGEDNPVAAERDGGHPSRGRLASGNDGSGGGSGSGGVGRARPQRGGHDASHASGPGVGGHGRRPSAISSSAGSDGDAASQSSSLTGSSLTAGFGSGREWRRPSDPAFDVEPPLSPTLNPLSGDRGGTVELQAPPPATFDAASRQSKRHRWSHRQGSSASISVDDINFDLESSQPDYSAYQHGGSFSSSRGTGTGGGRGAGGGGGGGGSGGGSGSGGGYSPGGAAPRRSGGDGGGAQREKRSPQPPQQEQQRRRRNFVSQQVAMFDDVDDLDELPPPPAHLPPPTVAAAAAEPSVPPHGGSRRQPPPLSLDHGGSSGNVSRGRGGGRPPPGRGQGGLGKPPPNLSKNQKPQGGGGGAAAAAGGGGGGGGGVPYTPPPPPDDPPVATAAPPMPGPPPSEQQAADLGIDEEEFLAVIEEMTYEELRESCDELGYSLPKSASLQELRAKLRQHYAPNVAQPQPQQPRGAGRSAPQGGGRSSTRRPSIQNWLV